MHMLVVGDIEDVLAVTGGIAGDAAAAGGQGAVGGAGEVLVRPVLIVVIELVDVLLAANVIDMIAIGDGVAGHPAAGGAQHGRRVLQGATDRNRGSAVGSHG